MSLICIKWNNKATIDTRQDRTESIDEDIHSLSKRLNQQIL